MRPLTLQFAATMDRQAVYPSTEDATLADGDRFEVFPRFGRALGRVTLPGTWGQRSDLIRQLEVDGLAVECRWQGGELILRGLPEAWMSDAKGAYWLESAGGGRFRLMREPLPAPGTMPLEAEIAQDDLSVIRGDAGDCPLGAFDVGLRAWGLSSHGGFDKLLCLGSVREMQVLDHQTRTALAVLRRMRGRALLCDEVGLGKTVEAGLILLELITRGLVRSALILTPPSLVAQWRGEMRRKFGIELKCHDDEDFGGAKGWGKHDWVIGSTHTAKRDPHRDAITSRSWDIVIIDEAHHLRNRGTMLWKLAGELRKQYVLLLTATPVQNNLQELYNLVTLLDPGLLSTQKDFRTRFMERGDQLSPRNVDQLHGLLGEVMVRNRRDSVGLQFTRRWARTWAVAPGEREAGLYRQTTQMIRDQLRGKDEKKPAISRMALMSLLMALGSSPQAAAGVMQTLLDRHNLPKEVADRLEELALLAADAPASAKVGKLLEILGSNSDKAVIFTQFRATQDMLAEALRQAGQDVAVFHGSLTRLEKEAAVEAFRGPSRLLLCTESGSEGRNLQFAHQLVNFDLPWNPMRIEQRIGRLSRIGQASEVHVHNLVSAGTLEAALLHLLDAKLNMFELVIGEVDMILGNLEEDRDFEDVLTDEFVSAGGDDEFVARMELLGSRVMAAKVAYLKQRSQDDRIFGNRFQPEGS